MGYVHTKPTLRAIPAIYWEIALYMVVMQWVGWFPRESIIGLSSKTEDGTYRNFFNHSGHLFTYMEPLVMYLHGYVHVFAFWVSMYSHAELSCTHMTVVIYLHDLTNCHAFTCMTVASIRTHRCPAVNLTTFLHGYIENSTN